MSKDLNANNYIYYINLGSYDLYTVIRVKPWRNHIINA